MVLRSLARMVTLVLFTLDVVLISSDVVGQPVVLESAELGATGRIGGTSISESQFVGWRFEIGQPLAVERVGGHMLSFPDAPGDIFAAIVELQSIDSVPIGAPFTEEEIVATTTFRPPFPSDEVLVPFSATLLPGSYALVFGTGLFGATGEGALHNGPDQPDIPPTNLSSFIYWSIPDTGQPFEWRLNLASNIRVVIEAHVLIPGDYNNDGNVDSEDYQVWRAGFGSTTNFAADGNGDHAVDAADYVVWRANVGAGAGGTSARSSVPEPAAWMLMAVAAILQVAARFRRRACPAKVFTAS